MILAFTSSMSLRSVSKVGSRTARTFIQRRNPVSKNDEKKATTQKRNKLKQSKSKKV